MTDGPEVPPQLDPSKPSAARGYDYLLGGKDNFEVDRRVVDKLLTVDPEARLMGRANRAFGKRAVRYMAEQGIRQFLDLGSGLPTTPPSVHEAARAVDPSVRVVYVDHDPIVASHSAAVRAVGEGLGTVLGDVRQPESVLSHAEVARLIDFDQPVGVLLFSVLHLMDAAEDPVGIVRQYSQQMAPGSYLGISHFSDRSDPGAIAHTRRISQETGFPVVHFRSDDEVRELFEGFDPVEPGLVDISDWRPEHDAPQLRLRHFGGVGRKAG